MLIRSLQLSIPMIAVLVVAVADPGRGRAEGSPMRALVGTFVYAGSSERGRKMIDHAIEHATEEMGFLRECIASDRLEEKTAIAPGIVIAREKNMVTVGFQGATYRSRINGGWVTATSPGGESISVRRRIRGNKLVQDIRTKKGQRVNLFRARGNVSSHSSSCRSSIAPPSAFRAAGRSIPNVKPPKVSIASVSIAKMPSNRDLASYYCAQYLGPLTCRAFGPVPKTSDIEFAFDVELALANSSKVPLPPVQTLFAFTAFPGGQDAQNLGTVPPSDELKMVVRLGLDPVQMLGLIRQLGKGELDRIKKGQIPEFTIPYEIEGTAWASVESLGRLATGFGPAAGQWRLQR